MTSKVRVGLCTRFCGMVGPCALQFQQHPLWPKKMPSEWCKWKPNQQRNSGPRLRNLLNLMIESRILLLHSIRASWSTMLLSQWWQAPNVCQNLVKLKDI